MIRQILLFCVVLPAFGAQKTALVAAASGSVTLNKTSQVSAFEWLAEGAVLETGPNSSATVILLNGHRFELGPRARATIGDARLSSISGTVKELDPIPPIPRPTPLAAATSTAAAGAFRGGMKVWPSNGKAAMAGPVVFRFQKVDGAAVYRIEVKDADGNQIAQEQTKSTEITVPLQPGAGYTWRVQAFGQGGVIDQGQAGFATLSNEQIQARQVFADAIRGLPDGLALLAEVDLESGLVREAIDGFHAALKLKPGDPAILQRLAQIEK
jgi:hypothetical protein